ncbi:C-type mannose receptor 2-like isoform X1 [Xyrauchen texanus]|uniref:C-type mannose receptor 2-like isoform X1 n=1 Tax=Xyrauchen texanus TaxID=154827 RepID=UPI00224213BA|nr:C-type mannose receptor 2-like isoform X1 [Xyrauchen texanus]XP_051986587.1 C-type mannose receptor 2-like isoform X1 [Xyrauchen texanus]
MKFVQRILLIILFVGFSNFPLCSSRFYYIINELKTWPDAQNYCRTYFYDLATFDSQAEQDQVVQTIVSQGYTGSVWTGIYDDRYSWRWSNVQKNFTYTNWGNQQPDNYQGREPCTYMYSSGAWQDEPCTLYLYFLCYNATTNTTVLITLSKTWTDALKYCRQYHTDLAAIENQAQNEQLRLLNPNGFAVHIGLYRDTWKWSDQSILLFSPWRSTEPNNYGGAEYCAELSLSLSRWNDIPCTQNYRFVCSSAQKIQILRVQVQAPSSLNVNDISTTFVKQFQQTLRAHGLPINTKLTLRTQPDGKTFHIKNVKEPKRSQNAQLVKTDVSNRRMAQIISLY